MPLLVCVHCDLTVKMKRIDAKAHGWTVKDVLQTAPLHIEEVWTCPRCGEPRERDESLENEVGITEYRWDQ